MIEAGEEERLAYNRLPLLAVFYQRLLSRIIELVVSRGNRAEVEMGGVH